MSWTDVSIPANMSIISLPRVLSPRKWLCSASGHLRYLTMNEISLYTQRDLLCCMHLLLRCLYVWGTWSVMRDCRCMATRVRVRVNACIYVCLSRDNDVVGGIMYVPHRPAWARVATSLPIAPSLHRACGSDTPSWPFLPEWPLYDSSETAHVTLRRHDGISHLVSWSAGVMRIFVGQPGS